MVSADLDGRIYSGRGVGNNGLHSFDGKDIYHVQPGLSKVMEPDPITNWTDVGFRLFEEVRYMELLQCYKKSMEEDTSNAMNWNGIGINLLCLGMFEEALECYERAIEKDPYSFMSWYGKATSLEGLGRHSEARECHDRAAEIRGIYDIVFNGKAKHR